MAMNVDEGELRPLDFVFLGDQRGLGLVLLNGQRRLILFRALALLCFACTGPREKHAANRRGNDRKERNAAPESHGVPFGPGGKTDFPTGGLAFSGQSSTHGVPACFPLHLPGLRLFRGRATCKRSFGKKSWNGTRIRSDATTRTIAQSVVRRARPVRWVSCTSDRGAHRAASSCSAGRSLFPRLETRRAHHAGDAPIPRVDVWLVLAHRHLGQRCFLLRDFLVRDLSFVAPQLQVALHHFRPMVRGLRRENRTSGRHSSPKSAPRPSTS